MKHPRSSTYPRLIFIFFLFILPSGLQAQNGNYLEPASNILPIMNVPQPPTPLVSPDRRMLLLLSYPGLPSVEELARPDIGLAGIRIDLERNTRLDFDLAAAMTLHDLSTLEDRQVLGLPDDGKIVRASWSSSSRYIAASILTDGDLELWLVDVKTARAGRLYPQALNNILGPSFSWLPGSDRLVCTLVPEGRGERPQVNKHRIGPKISDTSGRQTPVRTYRNLLQSLYDEILFDYMAKSTLAVIDVKGNGKTISDPAMFRRVSPSPDGNYILTEVIQYPYSYTLPYDRFPFRVDILDTTGEKITSLASLPLADDIPIAALAVRQGERAFTWQADRPATLWWAKALDLGDPRLSTKKRDQLYRLKAPFDTAPEPVFQTQHRFVQLRWGLADQTLVVEAQPETSMIRAWLMNPDGPLQPARLIYKRMKKNDRDYPDEPLVRSTGKTGGTLQVTREGRAMFLLEERATPSNERSLLKALDVKTLEETIIWTSDPGFYEKPFAMLDTEGKVWLTQRESFEDPPNFFIRNLERDTLKPIHFPDHPAPQVQGIIRERVFYPREDGVGLSADLYLPEGYTPDQGPLPTLLWIYPRAFASIENTAPRRELETRFIQLGRTSRMFWPLMGYALVDSPFIPIIGDENGRPNDTFLPQLEMGARAVIDYLVERGITDKEKVAVGGHSYGAFATANLLAHTNLFAAGIARSGAYNRTLTPFGFQHEFRDLWREPELYFKLSPFNHAAKIKAPLLLIHGEVDQNAGTFPEQSQRFYHALTGLGATARLVMLPFEDHSYYGRESILHMIWEMQQWMNFHVRDKETAKAPGIKRALRTKKSP